MNRYIKSSQEIVKLINMSTIVIARSTQPRHFMTKKGFSKKKEYLQIEGTPLIVLAFNPKTSLVTLNSLSSTLGRQFQITKKELVADFIEGIVDKFNFITNLDPIKYPTRVNISEFQSRDDFKAFKKDIDKWVKNLDNPLLKNVFEDKLFQMIQTQGASFETIPDLEKKKTEEKSVSHKRFGSQIFNRNCRWCPVADHVTYDNFTSCASYPFPMGIRSKDFCLPSEMLSVLVEMIRQLLTFKNVDIKYRCQMQTIFDKYNLENVFGLNKVHCCTYCGDQLDMTQYSSEYKSEENFIEICHRDPNSNFCIKNMYWGHGECNRRQGGYTECERINDAIGLINHNPTDYSVEQLDKIIASAIRAKGIQLTKSN